MSSISNTPCPMRQGAGFEPARPYGQPILKKYPRSSHQEKCDLVEFKGAFGNPHPPGYEPGDAGR